MIFASILEKSVQGLHAVKRHIESSNQIRSLVSQKKILCAAATPCFDVNAIFGIVPESRYWRVIDHCSAVTRLYAIYEHFTHELLRAYLAILEKSVSYENLADELRRGHERALGQLLFNLRQDRYSALSLKGIVSDLSSAFSTPSVYRLLPEAMLAHDQNLRIPELGSLFSRCGIPGCIDWLNRHSAVKSYARQQESAVRIDAEIKQLIDYRNEASHGGVEVDSVLGPDTLVGFANLLEVVFIVLAECVQDAVVKLGVECATTRRIGVVNEKFRNNVAVAMIENGRVSVGDQIFLRGPNYCKHARIESLKENGIDRDSVAVLDAKEIGFKFDIEPHKGAELILYTAKIFGENEGG